MITVSEKAESVLKEYFKEKEISPIRIFLQSGG
jgi:Fe-S cluster assembly iron-binding protein IscA